eukprot:29746_1
MRRRGRRRPLVAAAVVGNARHPVAAAAVIAPGRPRRRRRAVRTAVVVGGTYQMHVSHGSKRPLCLSKKHTAFDAINPTHTKNMHHIFILKYDHSRSILRS